MTKHILFSLVLLTATQSNAAFGPNFLSFSSMAKEVATMAANTTVSFVKENQTASAIAAASVFTVGALAYWFKKPKAVELVEPVVELVEPVAELVAQPIYFEEVVVVEPIIIHAHPMASTQTSELQDAAQADDVQEVAQPVKKQGPAVLPKPQASVRHRAQQPATQELTQTLFAQPTAEHIAQMEAAAQAHQAPAAPTTSARERVIRASFNALVAQGRMTRAQANEAIAAALAEGGTN